MKGAMGDEMVAGCRDSRGKPSSHQIASRFEGEPPSRLSVNLPVDLL